MAEKKERKKFLTPVGRLSFAHLFTKADPMEGSTSEPQYEATIIFDAKYLKANSDELARFNAIKAECDAVCKDKFKGTIKEVAVKIPRLWNPIRNGAEKEHLGGFGDGTIFFKAKTKRRPGVVGPDRTTPIDDAEAVYSGAYVRFSVTPFAYDTQGGKGVSIALNSVMLVKDGERLDGVSNPQDDFGEAPVAVAAESDNADDDLM